MNFVVPMLADLSNESDVEQKFVFQLMTGQAPTGLGIPISDIHTKKNVRKFLIGKGSDAKSYFPDYIITRGGVPLLVIEAKTPGADLSEAFREARLYAVELNAVYPGGVNPVQLVIATDGGRLLSGTPDSASPMLTMSLEDFSPYSPKFAEFAKLHDLAALDAALARLQPKLRPGRFWMPRRMVGGQAIQQEEVGLNSFGANISADFAHIFNPVSKQDRARIAKEAYIPSKRRERYVEPIDRVIRASTPPSEANSKTIEDTAQPKELIKAFRQARPLEHQVLLIVGSAGAGKTTFVDHLQEVALPREIRERTLWLRIDMNPAPISRAEIYDWVRKQIIRGCEDLHPNIDFDELDTLKAIHSVEINQFRKGEGRLYQGDQTVFNIKMAEVIASAKSDLHVKAVNYSRYFSTERGKLLVIVLDNCDKRLRDEQLLMFEAAQWIQKEFRGLVVLPLREETYDNHRNEPPLDTAIKDLVFRIEPPSFQKILFSRVTLALRSLQQKGQKSLSYSLPNGFRVEYPASEQAFYLSSIMKSIFEHDLHIRRLIVGLSARNMRRALEIFLEFCTSGHIGEDEILKIRQSEGRHVLPLNLVTTVLLRLNLRFYDSNRAYLKNIYSSDERDQRPQFFTRILMLRWLSDRFNAPGPKRQKGYHRVGSLREDMARFGIEAPTFDRELEALAKALCILSEDFRTEDIGDDDLISLSPAGVVHLQMAADVYYLAAVAEDTWFDSKAKAEEIAARIKYPENHYQMATTLYNAQAVVEYLAIQKIKELAAFRATFDENAPDMLMDIEQAKRSVAAYERSIVPDGWHNTPVSHSVGSVHKGKVKNRKDFGVFVELTPEIDGLLHSSVLSSDFMTSQAFAFGATVDVEVLELDHVRGRMGLKLAHVT